MEGAGVVSWAMMMTYPMGMDVQPTQTQEECAPYLKNQNRQDLPRHGLSLQGRRVT